MTGVEDSTAGVSASLSQDLDDLEGRALRVVERRRAALSRVAETRRKMRELGQKMSEQEALLRGDGHDHAQRQEDGAQQVAMLAKTATTLEKRSADMPPVVRGAAMKLPCGIAQRSALPRRGETIARELQRVASAPDAPDGACSVELMTRT
eukprot:CAMPEP_0115506736 /NCGR_PEP_ID=MMETSP0271-20121206/71327_1 /TAXON_ID=71861 /ORGANISM="Scrippsiella trochoidea, Strain CCMP3099" /LENGTH=150 /DNA_ID=CAMNT_0002936231 /DNA_START=8 /DNA_END=461 /DNA_ORIENTATION=+